MFDECVSMTRKRKKSKESPGQTNVQSKTKARKGKVKMAQNGGSSTQLSSNQNQNPVFPVSNNGQCENFGHQQSNQTFNLTQPITPMPQPPSYNYTQNMAMNTASPNFNQYSATPTPTNNVQNNDMMSMLFQRLDSMDRKLSTLDTI